MKRKIVKLGPSTHVVSLPSKWLKEQGLDAGKEIDVEERGSSLIVRNSEIPKQIKEVLDVTEYDSLIKRIFVSRYLKGADEIEVKFDTLEKSRMLQKRTEELVGMEVISQTKNSIIIKDLGGSSEETFESVVRRIFYIINTLAQESFNAIKKQDRDMEYLEDLEKNLNKFTDYCFRVLSKHGYGDYRKTAVYYTIIFLLEEIGDDYKALVKHIRTKKLVLGKDLVKAYGKLNQYFLEIESLFFEFSFEKAIFAAQNRDDLFKDLDSLKLKAKTINEYVAISYMLSLLDKSVKMMGQLLNAN